MQYDVVIVGGGPAGPSAALALGRARKRTLLCDSGTARNAAAVHVQNFVTRDGIPPKEFRRIAVEQLQRYSGVELRKERVLSIRGACGAFQVRLETSGVGARRVLLCTGMIDELPEMPKPRPAGRGVTVGFIGLLIVIRLTDGLQLRSSYTATHVFSGLFDVRDFTSPQDPLAPASGATNWRRLASDDRYGGGSGVVVQYADDSVRRYRSSTNPATRTLTLEQQTGQGSAATLRYEVQTDGSITLTGEIEARPATLRLLPVDRAKLPLLLRGR